MKKKLCFIVPNLGTGGAEKVALNLLNNINLKIFDLTLIIIYKNKGDYFKDLRKEVKCIFLEKNRIINSFFSIYRELKRLNPDIVLNFSLDVAILINILVLFFKRVYFINRQTTLIGKMESSKLYLFLLKIAYKNFDKIITQSNVMTKDLLKTFNMNRDKIVEINNPLDFNNINKNLDNNSIEIEFNKNDKNILCVGRLSETKNFDKVIKIIEKINNEKIKLYILGEGRERKNLEKLIKSLNLQNRVFLLGRKDNPYIYMKQADLFVLSSKYEGFPNALLEANACGLYAICSQDVEVCKEIIVEGVTGKIVDFSKEDEVIKTILKEIKRTHDRSKIIEIIKEKYEIKKIIYLYENIFTKSIKEK